MANANKLHFIGNLTRDPEVKFTPKGTPVASFALASNRYFKKADESKGEDVTFLDVVAFGKTADLLKEFSKKGDSIYIEARLKFESWADKTTGENRSKLRAIIEHFEFLTKKEGVEEPDNIPTPGEDDDIPF